jgi:hypothetical protein
VLACIIRESEDDWRTLLSSWMFVLEFCYVVDFSVNDDPEVFWGVVEGYFGLGDGFRHF